MKRRFFAFLLPALILLSCTKDDHCESTRKALAQKDRKETAVFVTGLILGLGPRTYNEKNLEKLADKISRSCDIKARLSCFDCIKTLPAQSEMTLTFSYGGTTTIRTIDLSYTADNEIRFVNIHD